MNDLWLYRRLSRIPVLSYRGKIMIVAFVGTHVPLVALIAYAAARSTSDWAGFVGTLGVALAATLGGTGLTLLVLSHMLRPVLTTSEALRAYCAHRELRPLPRGYTDEVGTLMADAEATLTHLEAVRVRLEHFDASTGLANRDKLAIAIDAAVAKGRPFAVCALSLQCFDRLATSVDAGTAQAAAQQMARRLEGFLGARVELARTGPAQFAFLWRDHADGDQPWSETSELLSDLLLQCGAHLRFEDLSVQPGLAAGIALFPKDGSTAAELIDAAGAAALAGERGQVAFYSAQSRAEARERFRLDEEMRFALRDGQFELHYQPVVDVAAGEAVGAEALIRWNHPERGMVPPGRFIPVAESSGLIGEIGLWVLDAACAQAAAWSADGLGDMKVAVNLSARQFRDPALFEHVTHALQAHKVSAGQLEIELTESAAMDDFAHSRQVMGRLRDLGVSIAIDDFGTGFASLSYLRRLQFDKLKLDREFVSNVHRTPTNQAICGALLELAAGLNLLVLAEGTENEEEILYLHQRGCALFQGFYLSRPVTADAFTQAIAAPKIADLAGRLGARDLLRSA